MVTKNWHQQLPRQRRCDMVNEFLNAAQPCTGIKNKVRQNDYGFTRGGLFWIHPCD